MTEKELEIQRKLDLARKAFLADVEPQLRRLNEGQIKVIHYNGRLSGSLGSSKVTLWIFGGLLLLGGALIMGGACVVMGGLAYYFERKADARFLNYLEEFQKKE